VMMPTTRPPDVTATHPMDRPLITLAIRRIVAARSTATTPRVITSATTSGLSTLNEYRVSARGARIARRDDRGYREYLREEQRGEAGCPARQAVLDQRGQATSPWRRRPARRPPRSRSDTTPTTFDASLTIK